MNKFDAKKCEKMLKVRIKDVDLFQTAFTHRSYLNEHPSYKNSSNERLEFLGDAVLQHLSSEYLYNKYPTEPEGKLTNFRSALVNTVSLAKEAKEMGYGDLLLLSKGEESTGGRGREYILANTFEAVLGALYIQEGIKFCRNFLEEKLFHKVEMIVENRLYKDAKSKFQEKAQETMGETPLYKVVNTWGSDHEKMFKVEVYIGNEMYGVGEGRSKQKAEQKAAIEALDKVSSV